MKPATVVASLKVVNLWSSVDLCRKVVTVFHLFDMIAGDNVGITKRKHQYYEAFFWDGLCKLATTCCTAALFCRVCGNSSWVCFNRVAAKCESREIYSTSHGAYCIDRYEPELWCRRNLDQVLCASMAAALRTCHETGPLYLSLSDADNGVWNAAI